MTEQAAEELRALDHKDERERCDRDAFFFLTAVLIIIVTIAMFNTEILQFLYKNLF